MRFTPLPFFAGGARKSKTLDWVMRLELAAGMDAPIRLGPRWFDERRVKAPGLQDCAFMAIRPVGSLFDAFQKVY